MLPRIVSILILGFVQLICVLISLVYLCLSFKFSGWLFPNSDSCIGFVRFDLISYISGTMSESRNLYSSL